MSIHILRNKDRGVNTIKMNNNLQTPSVEDIRELEKPVNPQDTDKQDIATRVFGNYVRRKNNRDRILDYWRFDEEHNPRTCIDYWNDSEKRCNSFYLKPAWKDDWQENIFNGLTNAKMMVYIAQNINQEDPLEFDPVVGVNRVIRWLCKFMGVIYNYVFGVLINEKLEKLKRALYCLTFGTVIVGVEYNKKKDKFIRKIKQIKNIYPDNIFVYEMQEQAGVSEELDLTWGEFVSRFKSGFWQDLELVPKNGYWNSLSGEMQFIPFSELEGDKVKILFDYDRENKLFHAIANGVLITKKHSPFPDEWVEDGEGIIPMEKTVFEMFSPFFFYGRSLSDKLQNMQDIDNKLWNMTLDQMKLTLNPPLLVGPGDDDIAAGDYGFPGAVWQLNDPTAAQWLKGGEVGMGVFRALQAIESSADRMSNIDPTQQAYAGGTKTKYEVSVAKQSGDVIANLFNLMMDDLESRLVNITIPVLRKALGSPKLKEFVVENVKLIDPKMNKKFGLGNWVLRIKNKVKGDLPLGYSSDLREQANLAYGEKTEIWELAKSVFKDIRIRMKPNPSAVSHLEKKYKRDVFAKLGLSIFEDERREKVIGLLAEQAGLDPEEWAKEMTDEQKEMANMSPEMKNAISQQTPGNVVSTLKQQLNQAAQSNV